MKIGYGDRRGYREADASAQKCAQAIGNWKPAELGTKQNSRADADHSSDDRSAEQSGLPCSIAYHGSDHSPETGKGPRSDEQRKWFQASSLAGNVAWPPNRSRLSCGALKKDSAVNR